VCLLRDKLAPLRLDSRPQADGAPCDTAGEPSAGAEIGDLDNDYPEGGSAMSNPLQLAHQWWATLDQADRQRVWNARDSYLAGDLVESMAKAGVPVVSDGRWSCVGVGPTGFTVPVAVQQLLERLSQTPEGALASGLP
jgi:hypothetical protein